MQLKTYKVEFLPMYRRCGLFFGIRSHIVIGSIAIAIAAFAIVGCDGKGTEGAVKDSLKGNVTYKGHAVSGEVVFIGSDRREVPVMINPDGSYIIDNPPKGELQVLVRGQPKLPPVPKGGNMPSEAPPSRGDGVAPPAKYARAGNGLNFNMTGGQQKYDIALE
jgi:hypothetical protein